MSDTGTTCSSGYYRYLITKTWERVEDATCVIIEGFEEFDFFITENKNKEWVIFDAVSGRTCCGKSGNSQSSIKTKAKKFLDKLGKEKLIKSIENSIAKHGVSPRYMKLVFVSLGNSKKIGMEKNNPFQMIVLSK